MIGPRRHRPPRRTVAVAAVLLAACTGGGADPDPAPPRAVEAPVEPSRSGGTLRIGLPNDPVSIDPRFVADEEGELVVGALFEPLVRVDASGRVVPGAASGWRVSQDGTEFTFTLREATFSDGTPVTAEDFARTFERIADGTADPASFLAYLLAPIEGAAEAAESGGGLDGIEVVDEATLVIRLTEPYPRYLLTLADPSLVPTPPIADDDPEAYGAAPVGNGPFTLVGEREPGGFLRLARAAGHQREPVLDEVVLQVYPDDPSRDRQWADLVDGLLHVADVGPARLETAASRFGTAEDGRSGPGLLDGPTGTVTMLAFDVTQPPFDDPVVRHALSRSVDRRTLAEEVLGGMRIEADRIVPPTLATGTDVACEHCRYDPEGAVALLEDAEVELPETLTLTFNRGATNAAVAEQVAADVTAALGIEVELEPLELGEYVPQVRRGEAPWFRLGWEANAPDPGAYLHPLFHSRNVGFDNLSRYEDPDTDELLEAGRAARTTGDAEEAFSSAEQRILDEAVVAPLLFGKRAKVVSDEVVGFDWSPTGRVDLAAVRLVDDAGAA